VGGSTIPVGPFKGGLNLSRSPRVIKDNELASCINFDIGNEGELILRPGVRAFAGTAWAANPEILGIAKISASVNEIYAQGIVGGVNAVYWNNNVHAPVWTNIITYAAGDKAGDFLQYNDKVWIPGVGPTAVGKSVTISGHAVANVAAMPKGTKSFMYKDRMFLFNKDDYTVYYSAATDPTNWPAANFFKINTGDGEPIISALVSGESIIFFKQNSSWILYYDSDPGLGTLRKLNTDVGVTSEDAVTVFKNDVYTMGHRGVYRLTNNFFEDISENLDIFKLRSGVTSDLTKDFICPLGDRLLIRVNTPTGYRYFVFFLETLVWSEYTFPVNLGIFKRFQDADSVDHYVAPNEAGTTLYAMTPYGANPGADQPVGSFATKLFDYGDSAGWKRLFWFSIEAQSDGIFTLSVKSDQSPQIDTVQPAPMSAAPGIFKGFLSRRFRTIQYFLVAVGPNFTFFSGTIMAEAKKKVVANATI
jgi:hypothetical protein